MCLIGSTLHHSVQWPGQCGSVDSNLEPHPTFYSLGSERTHMSCTQSLREILLKKSRTNFKRFNFLKTNTITQQSDVTQYRQKINLESILHEKNEDKNLGSTKMQKTRIHINN